MASPILRRTALDQIVGFSGKSLGDQLRYHELLRQPVNSEPLNTDGQGWGNATKPKPTLKVLPRPIEPISTDASSKSSIVPKPLPRYEAPPVNPIDQAQANLSDAQNQALTWRGKDGEVSYVPPSDKKHRLLAGLKTGGRYAVEALAHGGNPFAAIGAGIYGIGKGAFDPETPAKLRWQDRVDKAQGSYNRELGNAENRAQIDNLQSQPLLRQQQANQKEIDDLQQAYQTTMATTGEFSPDNPEHVKIHDRLAALGRSAPYGKKPSRVETPHVRSRAVRKGEYGLPEGTKVSQIWNGEKFVDDVDDKGNPSIADEVKPDTSEFTNSNLQQNISDAQGEIGKIESRMKDIPITITETDPITEKTTTRPNPEYTEHKNRRDSLIDQIRRWKIGMKPNVGGRQVNAPNPSSKPKKDGKYHYTPAQIRASLQSGQTYEDIYAKLKARPNVIIDEQ